MLYPIHLPHTANVSIVSFGKCNDMRLKRRAYLLGWQGNRQAKLVDLIYGDVFITRKGGAQAKSVKAVVVYSGGGILFAAKCAL